MNSVASESWMMNINLSLNQKLISITILAFTIIIGLITVNNYQLTKRTMLAAQQNRIYSVSDRIKYQLMSLMLEGKFDGVQRAIDEVSKKSKSIEELKIFSPISGVIVVSSQRGEIGKKILEDRLQRFLKQATADPFTVTNGESLDLVRLLPIENAPICHGCHKKDIPVLGVLEIRFSLSQALRNIKHIFISYVIFSLLGILLFSLVFWLIVIKLIDEPLDAVMEAIRHIEVGNYDRKVAIKRFDIIGRLSEKFNTMIARINEAREELKKLHSEQMKRASQMALTGEIASGIAHEIKNPLACISSALQIMNQKMEETQENKKIIDKVLSQVRKLDVTVKRILEFAKPARPVKKRGNINNVLQDTLFLITQLAHAKNIQVASSFDPDLKDIYGDGKLLRQLFLNISLNGIEAMPERGTLDISTRMIIKDAGNGRKEYAEVAIKDSGSGIPPENLQTIFEPFFTTKERGTGLGLAISMQIIEEHDGILEIDSKPSEGTAFRIAFPTL